MEAFGVCVVVDLLDLVALLPAGAPGGAADLRHMEKVRRRELHMPKQIAPVFEALGEDKDSQAALLDRAPTSTVSIHRKTTCQ